MSIEGWRLGRKLRERLKKVPKTGAKYRAWGTVHGPSVSVISTDSVGVRAPSHPKLFTVCFFHPIEKILDP